MFCSNEGNQINQPRQHENGHSPCFSQENCYFGIHKNGKTQNVDYQGIKLFDFFCLYIFASYTCVEAVFACNSVVLDSTKKNEVVFC